MREMGKLISNHTYFSSLFLLILQPPLMLSQIILNVLDFIHPYLGISNRV